MKLLQLHIYKTLIERLLFIYILFLISRLLFLSFNYSHFSDLSLTNLLLLIFYGIRFDTASIIAINAFFILMSIIPVSAKYSKQYRSILKYVYIVPNSISVALNLIDCGYFGFSMSRSTADLFNMLELGKDFSSLFWQYIADYWYLFIIWIILTLLTGVIYYKTEPRPSFQVTFSRKEKLIRILYQLTISVLIIIFGIIGFRGGIQLRPIGIVTAGNYTDSRYVAIILNTPFTIIKTFGKPGLKEVVYFDNQTALRYFNPEKPPSLNKQRKDNIVIIILESFSKEYIGSLNNNKGFTPFLDSLINNSLVFNNAYANGKRSIEAIPAILSGIPHLMNEAYITSKYSGNTIQSIASLLKKEGYTSSFFHGGTNGTMGFDNFIRIAGFDKYYGRTEYNHDADYDGKWGIYDEPFLQFFATTLNKTKQPFISAVFTLSSHHPYPIPEKYKGKFPNGKSPILQSIEYTDYSLKKFFSTVSTYPWFENTLFIITADHTSESYNPVYQSRAGMYQIPLLFYKKNSHLKGFNPITAQQSDILPTVLDYLGYHEKHISFGKSLFDKDTLHFAVNFSNETYQVIYNKYSLIFDGQNATAFFDIQKDPLMKNNLIPNNNDYNAFLTNCAKAFIQNFNSRMIKNKMSN